MASWTSCRLAAVLLIACVGPARASSFLSRVHDDAEDFTPELQSTIVEEIDFMLGTGDRQARDERLEQIEDMLRTTFQSMPKNEQGKLQHAAVRHTLHSYFVQRHAWFVRGLANLGEESNHSSPTGILQDRVEEFVQGAFEKRLGSHGLDLREMAVLVATYENLVHRETTQRLNATFQVLEVKNQQELPVERMDEVIGIYMIGYILGLNYSSISPHLMDLVRTNVKAVYPTWDETAAFLRDVRSKHSFHKSFFSRSDVEAVLEEVGDQYGRWQDRECQDLKSQLLSLEDRSIGTNGSGRVRLVDFYGSAMRDGNWQFSETQEYLAKLGALDVHDPSTPRVIIPNYINSPSNCLASSSFYSVCCINECEDLMDRVEHRFAAPTATPADIVDFVARLPSSSVASGRTLHPLLVARLEEIAGHHGGHVPLHGRLFAQWMHHAYPRECPYPHISGTTRPQTVREYKAQTQQAPTVKKEQMPEVVRAMHASVQGAEPMVSEECTAWSHDEELYVGGVGPAPSAAVLGARGVMQLVRPCAYLSIAVAAAVALARRTMSSGESAAIACGIYSGKDVFV